eukprot:Em0004g588a
MSGKRRYCDHCGESVCKSTYFEHQLVGAYEHVGSTEVDHEFTIDVDKNKPYSSDSESDVEIENEMSNQGSSNECSSDAETSDREPPPSKRIPSELSGAIKCIYAGMSEEQQYKVHENYRSDHNEKVSTWLLSQIKKLAKLEQYSDFHSRAIYRYYESRRRKFKDSAEGREERVKTNESKSKKRRSQKKLYLQRASVLKDSEKERWSQLDLSYMTDESDAEYNHRSVKQTHKPTWRSAGSGKDHEGFKRKERIAGLPSKSELPCGASAVGCDYAQHRSSSNRAATAFTSLQYFKYSYSSWLVFKFVVCLFEIKMSCG